MIGKKDSSNMTVIFLGGGRQYYTGLNEIRGLACLFVFLSHFSYITRPNFYLGVLGHYGVMLFLFLSGFLAYANHAESESYKTFQYLIKQYRRVFLLYIGCTLIMAIIPILKKYSYTKLMIAIILRVFMLQSWNLQLMSECDLNQVDWYLSVMMFCWLFQKPIIHVIRKMNIKQALFATLLILGIQIMLCYVPCDSELYAMFLYKSPIRIFDFIIGCLCARRFILKQIHGKGSVKSFTEIWGISVFILSIVCYQFIDVKCKENLFIATTSWIIVYLFANNDGLLTHFFNRVWIHLVAKHSLTIFLIHYVIIQYVVLISYKLEWSIWIQMVFVICILTIIVFLLDNIIRRKKEKLL